ncbi:putative P2Y purinoceptor 10 [Sceloporus undulatus]|uniref:putative P2Y purinoceptor 10 n=1 Tax=Sceloporus undulatus TaxID=8520 RepID=UPI001C4AB1A9|nr:putative P2Y purinoceptor 10 [Sceloporus undulatus]
MKTARCSKRCASPFQGFCQSQSIPMSVCNHSREVTHPAHLALNRSIDVLLMSSTGAECNNTDSCAGPGETFLHSLYAATYTIIFIPGLLTNSVALWILCRFISKQNKTIIFMVNLAMADFVHVLSLPLRIYYYVNYKWPFGRFLCQLSFYLKYLNMYASIGFLTCISVQRYLFLLYPFKAKNWKRRYDVATCVVLWIVIGAACLPFPLLRSSEKPESCFTDLKIKKIGGKAYSIMVVMVAEILGFFVPLVIIVYCTWKTKASLQECQIPLENTMEKRKALRMVSTCAVVFFVCFTPYHIVFFFFMMVKEAVIRDCVLRQNILYLHPFCLSLASLNCCLDPILYFFMTSEFQGQILRHSSLAIRSRLMSKESASSVKG